MMKSGYFLIVCLLVCVASPAWASTYYVSQSGSNANSCTTARSTTPTNQKRTITAGLGCLTVAGDILSIHGGTYNDIIEEIAFGATGTSWSAFMTVQAYPGEAVILRPNFGPGNVLRIQDNTIHHVLVKNLTLDGIFEGGEVNAAVLYCAPTCHDWHFDTVEVMNSDEQGILTGGNYMEFRNMHVHRNGASGPPYNAAEGVYATGDFNTFIGGEYDNNECNAVRLYDSAHNTPPFHNAHDNTISGLLIHDNGYGHAQLRSGLSACYAGGGNFYIGDGPNNVVINNVSYNGYAGWDDKWGQGHNNTYANNTIYNFDYCCSLHTDGGPDGLLGSINSIFQNNIIFRIANGATIDNSGGTTGNTVDHNQFTDPLFVDAAAHNFKLKAGSPAIDAGATVPSVVYDFLGAPRPFGIAYDIGAYEFGSTPNGGPRPPLDPSVH